MLYEWNQGFLLSLSRLLDFTLAQPLRQAKRLANSVTGWQFAELFDSINLVIIARQIIKR